MCRTGSDPHTVARSEACFIAPRPPWAPPAQRLRDRRRWLVRRHPAGLHPVPGSPMEPEPQSPPSRPSPGRSGASPRQVEPIMHRHGPPTDRIDESGDRIRGPGDRTGPLRERFGRRSGWLDEYGAGSGRREMLTNQRCCSGPEGWGSGRVGVTTGAGRLVVLLRRLLSCPREEALCFRAAQLGHQDSVRFLDLTLPGFRGGHQACARQRFFGSGVVERPGSSVECFEAGVDRFDGRPPD